MGTALFLATNWMGTWTAAAVPEPVLLRMACAPYPPLATVTDAAGAIRRGKLFS